MSMQVTSAGGWLSRTASAVNTTVCGWVRTLFVHGSIPHFGIFQFDNGSSTWHGPFSTTGDNLVYSDSAQGSDVTMIASPGFLNVWVFWAMVKSGGNVTVYYRTNASSSLTNVGTFSENTTGNAVYLFSNGYGDTCHGTVRITSHKEFNVALNSTQLMLESQFRSPQAGGCVCYLSGSLGSTVGQDTSGSSNNYTVTGTVTLDSDEPTSMSESLVLARNYKVTIPGKFNRRLPPFWPPSQIPRSTTTPSIVGALSGTIDSTSNFTGSLSISIPNFKEPINPVVPGELNRRLPPFWPPSQIPRSTTLNSQVSLSGNISVTSSLTANLGGSAVALGTISAASSWSGSASGGASLSSTLPIASSINSNLSGNADIIGTLPVISSISSTMLGSAGVVGTLPITSSFASNLTGGVSLSSTLSITTSCSGILTGAANCSSSLPITSSISGNLGGLASCSGSLSEITSFSGGLLGSASLVSTIPNVMTFDGTLINISAGAMQGSLAATTTFSGNLSCIASMAASLPITSSFTAPIIGYLGLSSSCNASSTLSANLTGIANLAATLPITSTFITTCIGSGVLSGNIPIVTNFSGTLINVSSGALQGTISCISNITGTLAATLDLSGVVSCSTFLTSALKGSAGLTSSIPCTSTWSGTLTSNLPGEMAGNFSIFSSFTGTLSTTSTFPRFTVYGNIAAIGGSAASVYVVIRLVTPLIISGIGITTAPVVVKPNSLGYFEVNVTEGAEVEISIPYLGFNKTVVITEDLDVLSLV